MADVLLAVVDVLAEIFRAIISQRYLLLIAGLIWWFIHSIQKSLKEEEEKEKERTSKEKSSVSVKTRFPPSTDDLNSLRSPTNYVTNYQMDSLDYKLDTSHNSEPYIMPLSSNVATDSEPCDLPSYDSPNYDSSGLSRNTSSTFMKLRATFENAANQQNNAMSMPCLNATPQLRLVDNYRNYDTLSHSNTINTIHSPSRSPYYGANYNDNYGTNYQDNDLRNNNLSNGTYDCLRRPLSPRSLGNSPVLSPKEERRSREEKRRSVCGKCRTAGKSTSWSEADSQSRGRVKRTPDRDPSPATTVFYCGRYISVSNGKQVQIGDHCNMQVTTTYDEDDDDDSNDEESVADRLELDQNVVSDSEQDDSVFVATLNSDEAINSDTGCTSEEEDCGPLVCSFCRAKMTDDEKSELLPVCGGSAGSSRSMRSINFPLNDVSNDVGVLDHPDIIGNTHTRSASVSTDGATPPITDEEKEKLFRDAKVKIYEALGRHRELSSSSPNFDREDNERKSLRNLTFWKKRKQSTGKE